MGAPGGRYWIGPEPRPTHGFTTSRTEVAHLVIAYVVLTLDITLVRFSLAFGPSVLPPTSVLLSGLAFGAAAALTGFVAHEMAHKISAERHGFWAEFRMSPMGLVISVVTSLFGFLFALPGATVVGGMGDIREWGRTSLAGPLTNLVEGSAFLAGTAVVLVAFHAPLLAATLVLLAFVNGVFATFNLLPFGALDGQKVYRWNRGIWVTSFAVAAAFTVGAYLYWGSVLATAGI